jgi:hypothetical protein
MRRILLIGLMAGGLAACDIPSFMPTPDLGQIIPPGDFASAVRACDAAAPRGVGNYLAQAQCVNTAEDNYRLPYSPYADLIRLHQQLRLKVATAIDSGAMAPAAGEKRLAEVDDLIAAAEHDRDTGHAAVAEHRVEALQAMLQR